MNLGNRLAVIADVHGQRGALQAVLQRCLDARVSGLVLLGDLFDRIDQAEACVSCFNGWTVTGVLGNHERDALSAAADRHNRPPWVDRLLDHLGDRIEIENALFVHDGIAWRSGSGHADATELCSRAQITFAGHTHVRQARDDRGPLDLSLGRINLRPDRRYLVNPGAVVEGQFAIWDRRRSEVVFERI